MLPAAPGAIAGTRTLFSPSAWSSVAGWPMPTVTDGNPGKDHLVSYLTQHEGRYDFPIVRHVHVIAVERTHRGVLLRSNDRKWEARAIISATGSWGNPYLSAYSGAALFNVAVQDHQVIGYSYASQHRARSLSAGGRCHYLHSLQALRNDTRSTHWLLRGCPTGIQTATSANPLLPLSAPPERSKQQSCRPA